jgi:hypothetical protein
MLTLIHYLPYMLVTCFIVLIVIAFTGQRPRTDYRRVPRQQHYRWNDKSAHRD